MTYKIPGVYVEIRGDSTKFRQDFKQLGYEVKAQARGMSDAMNNALAPEAISRGIQKLAKDIATAGRAATASASDFKQISAQVADVARVTGMSEQQFASLQQRMLQFKAQTQADKAFEAIQRSVGLTARETALLRYEMGDTAGAVRMVQRDMAAASAAGRGLGGVLGEIRGTAGPLLGIFGGLSLISFARDVLDTTARMQGMENAFKAITYSAQGAKQEMAFVREEAARLGLDLMSSADAYKQLAAAAQGTSMAGQVSRDIFIAISEAATVLGLSSENVSGALLAISQMISKGTVSAEELRGQLGERLPGAFQLAAQAMGVTTAELGKMLQQGAIATDDFLPKFAAVVHDRFGQAAQDTDTLTQAMNRLNTALTDFRTLNPGVSSSAAGLVNAFAGLIKHLDTVIFLGGPFNYVLSEAKLALSGTGDEAERAASAYEHLSRAGDMVERALAQQAAKAKAEHVDPYGLEEAARRVPDILKVIKDEIETYQYERADKAEETAATLVDTEKDAASQVVDTWRQALASISGMMGQVGQGGISSEPAAPVDSAYLGWSLANRIIQVPKPDYSMRTFGRVNGKDYYSQETLTAAISNANADYQRQLAAYEAAVKAAEELRRQWESVLSSYESLLTSIEDYQPTMSFSELSANLDQATASIEAAKSFLKDLTYYAGQLQGYKSGFESLGERIQAEITARERAGWGATDYMALYQSLGAQYAGLDQGASDYYEQALDLSEQMLDALTAIEGAQETATAATLSLRTSLVGVFGTLDTSIAGLYGSNLAPSQSLEFFTGRYATLYNRASSSLSSEDVGALSSFITQGYLPFLQSYGGDYQGIFDSVIQDLQALEDATGYSILGTFSSLQDAMEETGAFAEWLAARLGEDLTGALGTTGTAASSSTAALANITTELGTLADNTTTSLSGVTTALNSLVTTLQAAIASISSSTGTTINVSVPSPGTPSVTQYDYGWAFTRQDNYWDYMAGGAHWYQGTWTTPHGGSVYDYQSDVGSYASGRPTYGFAYTAAEGLLFDNPALTLIGEGSAPGEAAVPLDERHLEPFMRAAGYGRDNTARDIAAAVKAALGPMFRAGGQGGTILVKVVIDGREVGNVVASQMETNSNLVRQTRRAVGS